MTLPIHLILRAIGQGAVTAAAISGTVYAIGRLFGGPGLIALAVIVGPGFILLSYVLERHAKRAQKESE